MAAPDRRSQILAAAEKVLGQRGVRRATVEEITTRAGVAKGTFYLYFESRDALLEALGERSAAGLLAEVEAALKRKNRAQALTDFVAVVAAARPAGPIPPGLGSDRTVPAALARFLAEGTKAGDFDVRNPQATATFLYAGLRAALEESGTGSAAEKARLAAEEVFRAAVGKRHKKK